VLYEGRVFARNEYGRLILSDKGAAIALESEAPKREVLVNPMDAVQWALFYPNLINPEFEEQISDEADLQRLRTFVDLYRQGKFTEALTALNNGSARGQTPQFFSYRAGLLLSVGRVNEAKADIEKALQIDSSFSDAFALQAVISVVQNDKEQALTWASHAVKLNPTSSTARLALSYAQQAHFQIEEALESLAKAVQITPQNAFSWSRLAELNMALGYLDRALKAAQRAVSLNPFLAKTQTVLGFAYLIQMDTAAAKGAFTHAIELDQADPMPRLGKGLAKIREGDLEAGRIELEIAASLDPANSLIRSYLGKAYFEEKRYGLAETQFDLARERDPKDPTPWLYDGIMKQTQNQPVEALRDIQKSIELNDNRAVYRSRLLLDQDLAARGSSLARIYDNLGFEKRAIVETAKSLSLDPSNHSAHRFLSDAYLNAPWHEIARASELLQAQLLQPINVNPVQPQLAVADLNIITGTAPSAMGFNEFTPLLERNKPQLVASGVLGNHSTAGIETVLSALYGRASVSVGQFHYNTNGFRTNNDQKHNIYNAFFQYAVTSRFNVQAEVRTRNTENGDLLLRFDRPFNPYNRRELTQDTVRLGTKFSVTPHQDFITSAMYTGRNTHSTLPTVDEVTENITKDRGYQIEGQYLYRGKGFNVLAGGGTYQFQVDKRTQIDFSRSMGESCPAADLDGEPLGPPACNPNSPSFDKERTTGYLYANLNQIPNLSGTLGLSYDSVKDGVGFELNKFNPKLGVQWDLTPNLRLRAAWFKTVKSFLVANQTLEPTHVAGFNQLFDDVNGTQALRRGVALDGRVIDKLYGGLEISARNLKVPFFDDEDKPDGAETQREKLYQAYLYWLPHRNWAVKGESRLEQFMRSSTELSNYDPSRIETFSTPLSVSYFNPSGVYGKLTTTFVKQELKRSERSGLHTVADSFLLLDAILGYRLPRRRGIVSLEGRNLLDEHFYFRSYNFQFNEIASPRFIPNRTFFFRITLNF
jgi:tetratricopeptide (TPR) repeat protein